MRNEKEKKEEGREAIFSHYHTDCSVLADGRRVRSSRLVGFAYFSPTAALPPDSLPNSAPLSPVLWR